MASKPTAMDGRVDFDLQQSAETRHCSSRTLTTNSWTGTTSLILPVIKWSSTLRDRFKRGERLVYNDGKRLQALYRPFVSKDYFAETAMNDRLTRNHYEMFGKDLRQPNKVICFRGLGNNKALCDISNWQVG